MILDLVEQPAYEQLAALDDKLIWSQEPALDMPAAFVEISQAGGNLDTPGGQYRHLYVQLGAAMKKGDMGKALALGEAALVIAREQDWFHMQAPIQFALAAGLNGAGRHEEAIARYWAAELAVSQGRVEGPEEAKAVCDRLRLQARLGRASVLVSSRAWGAAAELYEETAPIADELEDDRAVLDCCRLASFCREREGNLDEAWRLGLLGLEKARTLDAETLQTSTFPYLGVGLMRLTESGSRYTLGPRLEQEIVAIAGTRDWRPTDGAGDPRSPPTAEAER
jgi:hypothetical protein